VKRLIVIMAFALCGCPPADRQPTDAKWETISGGPYGTNFQRTKVPQGWIVAPSSRDAIYVPDPEHAWLPAQVESVAHVCSCSRSK